MSLSYSGFGTKMMLCKPYARPSTFMAYVKRCNHCFYLECSHISKELTWDLAQRLPPIHRKSILEIREGQNEVKVIKFNLSKSVFLTSHSQKRHFRHQGRSKLGQGHPRSPSAIFQKLYFWPPIHRKGILDIREGQNQVRLIQGHQAQFFRKCVLTSYA